MTAERPRVLIVDDDPDLVAGLALHLRLCARTETATRAADAIALLESTGAFAVLLTDLRMPGMDGLALLDAARERWPDTVRIMLTGQGDLTSAASAVNTGQIFRFLLKPCPPDVLVGAVTAAIEQHRLVMTERVLLRQTLLGCVKALSDVLSLANPLAFGRAQRIRARVAEIASSLGMPERWMVEIAAMLTQVGTVTLPPTTVDKLYYGLELDEYETPMVARIPEVIDDVLRNLPRLEDVRAIILAQQTRFDELDPALSDSIALGAQILKVATDFDALEAREDRQVDPVLALRARHGEYSPIVLDALHAVLAPPSPTVALRLSELAVGMRLAEDLVSRTDLVLVPRGFEIDATSLARLRNFRSDTVRQPIIVHRVAEPDREAR